MSKNNPPRPTPRPFHVLTCDLKTKQVTEIPIAELAPGMARVSIEGMPGDYYVMVPKFQERPYLHPPFTEDRRRDLASIYAQIEEVYPHSLERFEEELRRERSVEKELVIWSRIAATYAGVLREEFRTFKEKRELYRLLVHCSFATQATVLEIYPPKLLPIELVQKAVNWFFNGPTIAPEAAPDEPQFDAANFPAGAANSQQGRSLIFNAEIIFAQDIQSGNELLLYGSTLLKKGVREKRTIQARLARFSFDPRTNALRQLIGVVREVKGTCDLGRGY